MSFLWVIEGKIMPKLNQIIAIEKTVIGYGGTASMPSATQKLFVNLIRRFSQLKGHRKPRAIGQLAIVNTYIKLGHFRDTNII
jgi:hypothetical protein